MPSIVTRLGLLAAVTLLAACGEGREDAQTARLESGVLYRNDGPELDAVDPHKAGGAWVQAVTGDLFVGLMRRGPDGRPQLALAESFDLSEDGLTWTFSLREAQWSDGREITADDVVYSFRRAVDPATAAAYVEVFAPVVNARAILDGQAEPETLGVSALDERTVEIRLVHPMPFLPQLLADGRGAVLPGHVIEVHGDAWTQPQNIVTNGAYTLVERVVGSQTVLRKNPLFYDAENVCFDEVFNFPINSPETAARRARSGELDIAANVPASMLARVREELPDHMRQAVPPGTFYFVANTERDPFGDVRVREALSIAIDREFAFTEVIPDGLIVANGLVPDNLAAPYPTADIAWGDEPVSERRERALTLLADAGFGPDNPLTFEFAYPSGGNGDRIAPVLQQDWNSLADWVQVEIFSTEAAIHYQNLRAGEFDAALGGWVASVQDTSYMLDVIAEDAAGNFSGWSDDRVQALLAQAQDEQDEAARAALFREAEQIALDDFAIAPFFHFERNWIVHPRIEGWIGGMIEYTPTTHLCVAEAE
ncbi:MAG: peptide ABC transporter substrate-binding protein [Alphaproteobacteria bacterium]|nr:peptide ABC transporter substrate-binding protein [Alphaproteobacteria bacterium]